MKHISMTSQTCSGCTACLSVCPKDAISFSSDSEGFQIPIIDEEKCIDCGICIKTCPAININQKKDSDFEQKAYAFQYHDEATRQHSASGALFPAFAQYFINTLHGYVCGCVLNENISPVHIVSNKWHDVERMQDSKYVQSDMGNCFKQIEDLLNKQYPVLFTGTSCQVAGLKASLAKKNISSENLLTIDFFCHGVPSPLIWKEYINYYEKRHKRKVIGYRFRNKKFGWGKGSEARGTCFLSCVKYKTNRNLDKAPLKFDDVSFSARQWFRIFFSNLCIRQYCHQCPYTNIQKPADITMGDFWGIEQSHAHFDDHKGCSLALVRTQKAHQWLLSLSNTELLEVSINDIIRRQGNAFNPSKAHSLRKDFWTDYQSHGYAYVFNKYLGNNLKYRTKDMIKYLLFLLHLKKYG